MANKVMLADGSVTDAWAEYDIGINESDVWVTLKIAFLPAALTLWDSGNTSYFTQLWNPAHSTFTDYLFIDSSGWEGGWGFGNVPPPAANVWQTCEIHHIAGGAVQLYISGSLIYTSTDTIGDDTRFTTFGLINVAADPANLLYFDFVSVGTARGGTDLYYNDFSSGNLSSFTSTSGSVSVIDDPFSSPGDLDKIGICVAFGYDAFDVDAIFTRIDDPNAPGLAWDGSATRSVKSWTTDRGRAYELDKTQAGTATIVLTDTTGIFDPTNASGPLYGKITPMMRAKINVQNPATRAYHDIFTGFIESWEWTMDTAEKVMTVTIGLVDGFEPLSRGEIQPEANGVTTFPGLSGAAAPQSRLDDILNLAEWPDDGLPATQTEWRKLNTGNVYLKQTIYNVQTSFLAAMQDVADAEFPGVANIFINKKGAVTFYGRYPRFQPTNYPDDVKSWKAADKPGLSPAGSAALIADITWALDSKNIINASLCFTANTAQTDLLAQLVVDPAQAATNFQQYGIRTLSLPDLIVDGQPVGGGVSPQPAATANEVCKFYSQYYVDNYALPALRISHLEFHARPSSDSATWGLMTGVEIGDIITVYTSNPGGGGFGKETDGEGSVSQFFVEGIHNVVNGSLSNGTLDWTMTLDVSPRAWFTTAPFGG